jgi:hypothetical protein
MSKRITLAFILCACHPLDPVAPQQMTAIVDVDVFSDEIEHGLAGFGMRYA